MPIVFVHGVNNRLGDGDYEASCLRIQGFLSKIFAAQINVDADKLSTYFPYWGDQGVHFRWKNASIPGSGTETLGIGNEKESLDSKLWLNEVQAELGAGGGVSLAKVARNKSFHEATDLLWDTIALSASTQEEVAQIAALHKATADYIADGNPYPKWVRDPEPNNQQFLENLLSAVQPRLPAPGPQETLGIGDHLGTFKTWFGECVSRLGSGPGDAISTLLLSRERANLHLKASRFIGDILVYINSRGTAAARGPIVQTILKDIDDALKNRTTKDPYLILIGHSLGGVILYDILTHFRPDLPVDLWITIGSQVAVFEEMSLYRNSESNLPPNPPTDRLPRPAAAKAWINVFDTNDAFSFAAAQVFDGVDDHSFDTGYGAIKSHGGYFSRPSFYKRLGIRAKANLP